MKKYAFIKNLIYPFAAVSLFIIVWAAAAKATGMEIILPSPDKALREFFALIDCGNFYPAVLHTLFRSLISFGLSALLACILAAVSGLYNPVYRLLNPIIVILRSTPTISIILLSLIWLNSSSAPVLIAFLIIFPSMYSAVYSAIMGVDYELIEMSKVYRVSAADRVFKLYIPTVMPAALDSAKSNISLNLKIIIASEVLAQTALSMGRFMQQAKMELETSQLLAWTIAAVLLSYLLEGAVAMLKKALVRWQK